MDNLFNNAMLDIFFSSTAFAIASFSLFLVPTSQSKSPLVLVLVCLLFFSLGPIVFKIMPALIQLYVSLIPAVFFLFLPSLWFYHEATISQSPWEWQKSMLRHFTPLPFMLLLGMALFFLPDQDFTQMFFSSKGVSTLWLEALSILFFIVVLGWGILSCYYVASIMNRTIKYRTRIRAMYADETGRSLHWLGLTLVLIIFTWLYALVVLTLDDKLKGFGVSDTGVLILLTAIVWLIALNGVKQRPGFEDTHLQSAASSDEINKKSYERSALNDDDLQRISIKLTAALSSDKVHLSPELNLLTLSKHVREPSQYVSQTLSQKLNTTFFDFINKARIDEAKQILIKTNDTVFDIAYATGFNSRSSFYKAFRQYTNQTPNEFRKAISKP